MQIKKDSKHKVLASLQANTYVITGQSESKPLQEMLPKVIGQLGNDNLSSLRQAMESASARAAAAQADDDDDDIPDIDADFEEVSKA